MRLFTKNTKRELSAFYNAEIVKEVEKLPINAEAKKIVYESYELSASQKRSIIISYIMERKKSIIYAKTEEDKNILTETKRYYYNILTAINEYEAVQAVDELKQADVVKYQKLIDAIDEELSSTTFIRIDTKEDLLGTYDNYLLRLGSKSTKIHTQRRSNTKILKQDNLFDDDDYREYSLQKLANKNSFDEFFEVPADEFLDGFTLNKGNNNLNKEGYYTSLQLFIDNSTKLYKKVFDSIVNGSEKTYGNKLKFSFESFRYNKSNDMIEISNAIKAI